MKTFILYAWISESHTYKYHVEAETEEEAKDKVINNDVDAVKKYYGDSEVEQVFNKKEFEEETGFKEDILSDEG